MTSPNSARALAGMPAAPADPLADASCCHGLVVRPGDTLIPAFSRRIGREGAEQIKQRVAERLPGVDVAVMDSVDQLAVYRPEG